MQIDRLENILFNTEISRFDLAEKTATKKPKRSLPPKNENLEYSIIREFDPIIERSLRIEDMNYLAVHQAQNELKAGQIDDLDAAIIAAGNIMTLGI